MALSLGLARRIPSLIGRPTTCSQARRYLGTLSTGGYQPKDWFVARWVNVNLLERAPRPFEARRADIHIRHPLGHFPSMLDRSSGFLEYLASLGPKNGLAVRFDGRAQRNFVKGVTQRLSELQIPLAGRLTVTFYPWIVKEALNQGLLLEKFFFHINFPAPPGNTDQDLLASDTVTLTWRSLWQASDDFINERSPKVQKRSLSVSSDHQLSLDHFVYPHHKARFLEGIPDVGHQKLSAEDVHPILNLHSKVAQHYFEDLNTDPSYLPDLNLMLFDSCPSHPDWGDLRYCEMEAKGFGPPTSSAAKQEGRDPETHPAFRATLRRSNYQRIRSHQNSMASKAGRDSHRAYVAFGSNVGDSVGMIEKACSMMEDRGILVWRTSAIYRTKPMYLEHQDDFLNGVFEIETTMNPRSLLETLKYIEKNMGRVKTIDNGPRPIDLDILFYGNETIHAPDLIIPHPRIGERAFVLKPLCDLIPEGHITNGNPFQSFRTQLDAMESTGQPLSPLTPLKLDMAPILSMSPSKATHLMTVLNLTPDSFSDGGVHSIIETNHYVQQLKQKVAQGHAPTIVDVGGQSTRPQANEVSQEEELSRILPTIQALRADTALTKIVISVDTFRASVAKAAIEAGADIVNDVSAGKRDSEMLRTIADLGCTCILMHMRGDSKTMSSAENTGYPDGVIKGIGTELLERVQAAQMAGIRRWRIILDPGIGFAKTQAQNLEILKNFDKLRTFEGLQGFPWVIGASRKGFIGKITGVDQPSERVWGTAACVVAAVQGGADIVRVHDVEEMGQVVKMADAIWRS